MVSSICCHHLLILYLCFPLLLSFFPGIGSDLVADREALLRLSSSIRGRTLRWNRSDQTPCTWEGVNCDTTTNRVISLRLPGARLSGQLPENTIGNLTQLQTLSLRRNFLSGPLPSDLRLCTQLTNLFLQENDFSGEIQASLFSLVNLQRLALAGNRFTGEISPAFNSLTHLRTLQLENNQLSGSLPELDNLPLRDFNVSFNRLNGSIPRKFQKFPANSFLGNSLCGPPLNSCSSSSQSNGGNSLSGGAIAGIVIGSVFGFLLLILVLFILWRGYKNRKILQQVEMSPVPASPAKPPENLYARPSLVVLRENHALDNGFSGGVPEAARAENAANDSPNGGLVFFGESVEKFSLEDLLRASAEVLGKGTLGTTYRAYLDNNVEVVVKRLRNVCVSEREFREKLEWLGMLDHENLVPVRAYYYGREEKLIMYESMPTGSLAAILHGDRGPDRPAMNWEVRSQIAIGVANGIEYLHSLGPTVSHGSIKSSNIFFADDNTACISEYCITPLVSSSSTPNTVGYCAPEAIDTRRVSQKADVYSFGILLLELLTGKAPANALNEGIDLHRWVQSVVQEKWTIDVFDHELIEYQNNEEQMVQLLHLAITCTSLHPERRPSIVEVSTRIKQICD